ncbi:MAG TPA: MaoC/PaaZ C-terminal domain-containing protein [Cryptosporangiaceae bacterium]|nr:MaoC/PaaZ C-terminal domain-containing protein [Cryptosporangiaceae bacterium]
MSAESGSDAEIGSDAAPGATELWYQDLVPGHRFDLGEIAVDGAEMRAFAERFDPQWYHVDPVRAADGPFGGLIASGWFTASLFMRAYVDGVLSRAAASASPGVEELRWLAPVRAGDRLRGTLEVLDRTPSSSRPGVGTVTLLGTLRREPDGEPVLRCRFRGWFDLRPGLTAAPETSG